MQEGQVEEAQVPGFGASLTTQGGCHSAPCARIITTGHFKRTAWGLDIQGDRCSCEAEKGTEPAPHPGQA